MVTMTKGPARKPAIDRFQPRVDTSSHAPCWVWTGATNGKYGVFNDYDQQRCYAHRWSYEHFVGPIPDGLQIDHLCRRPLCVRPEHLEPVTNRENHRRGLKGQQTHCIHGHPFDEANTYIKTNGTRACRTCMYDRDVRRGRHKPPITHCKRGHEFTPENTRIRPNGTRECRECQRNHRPSRVGVGRSLSS